MGTRPRPRPQYLPAKLLAIRQYLRLSQSQIAARLGLGLFSARISEYEVGTREPNLMVLLRYSEITGVPIEAIINDRITLKRFNDVLNAREE